MESDPLLLKASLAFAALMAGAAWLPNDVTTPRPAPVAMVTSHGIDQALRDYEWARLSGVPLDRCTRAHAVALAYLRAEDRAGYQTWEDLGARNCAAAGFPSESETAALPVPPGISSTASDSPIMAPRGGGT